MKFVLSFLFLLSLSASAAEASQKKKMKGLGAKLKTDHSFGGLNVKGRYQMAHEGLATVENEKPILDILDYPKNFNDRVDHSKKWVR